MLEELCRHAGLEVEEIGYISGPISQWHAWLLWQIGRVSPPLFAWLLTLPLRPLPPLFDRLISGLTGYPPFCITLEAMKPRMPMHPVQTELKATSMDFAEACHEQGCLSPPKCRAVCEAACLALPKLRLG